MVEIMPQTIHHCNTDVVPRQHHSRLFLLWLFLVLHATHSPMQGILRQMTINDLPVGRDVDEALRLVQAFQFTDAHGEVCPANWKPGSKTIKPDVEGSKQFFGTA